MKIECDCGKLLVKTDPKLASPEGFVFENVEFKCECGMLLALGLMTWKAE